MNIIIEAARPHRNTRYARVRGFRPKANASNVQSQSGLCARNRPDRRVRIPLSLMRLILENQCKSRSEIHASLMRRIKGGHFFTICICNYSNYVTIVKKSFMTEGASRRIRFERKIPIQINLFYLH